MARLNLFTELSHMEDTLDERTELSILRTRYRFSVRSPVVLLLVAFNLTQLSDNGQRFLAAALVLVLLCEMLAWPLYQLSAGVYHLEIDQNPLREGLPLRTNVYFGVLLATQVLAGGLVPLALCMSLPARPAWAALGGLYLLGVAGSYLAFCFAHNRYVKRQKPELPPCGRQNRAALLTLALLAAGGAALLAAGLR